MKTPLSIALTTAALTVGLAGCALFTPVPPSNQTACADKGPAMVLSRISTRGAELAALPAEVPVLHLAAAKRKKGFVTLSCRPSAGHLADCLTLYEAPKGLGFADAALAKAPQVIYPGADAPERIEVSFRYEPTDPPAPRSCALAASRPISAPSTGD